MEMLAISDRATLASAKSFAIQVSMPSLGLGVVGVLHHARMARLEESGTAVGLSSTSSVFVPPTSTPIRLVAPDMVG